jgi:hypothetical protein
LKNKLSTHRKDKDLDYEPMEDEELTKEAAFACAIELSKQHELTKWDGLQEAIELPQQQAAATPAPLAS